MTCYLGRTTFKVRHLRLIIFSIRLIRCLCGDVASIRREIIATILPKIVGSAYGGVCLKLETRRRILHHHINHTTRSIALHIGRQRLRHHEAIHQIGGENIERNVAVLIARAWNLHPVHKRIIVSFVHATKDGV